MKKAALAFYLFATFGVALPVQASIQPGWVGNFLIGISGGYGDLYGDAYTALSYQDRVSGEDIFQTSFLKNYRNSGFIFGVLAGYQEIQHLWLAGVEINFDLQAIDKELKYDFRDSTHQLDWSGTIRYQRKNMIGISGRLGFALTAYFMPYLRVGGEFSRDKLIASFLGDPVLFPNELVIGERHWLHRFLLGIGAEIPLVQTCGATIRIEYNLHSKARTIQGQATFLDRIYSPTLISSFQPQMQSAKVSFIWNFF